jgi:competence protein ComEC
MSEKLTLSRTLSEKLRPMPLLKALPPMMGGVTLGTLLPVPLAVWAVGAVVCAATGAAILWRRRGGVLASVYVGFAILFFGAALARIHTPTEVIPRGERVWIELRVTDEPTRRAGGRSASAFGETIRWRPEGGEWQPADEKLLVSVDTMWRVAMGDRVTFSGYVNPIAAQSQSRDETVQSPTRSQTQGDRYARLMRARGYTGRTYVSQYSHPVIEPDAERIHGAWARRLQSATTERLRRLNIDPDALAVAAAMTTGDRSGLSPEIRSAYSRTGAAHLLAVSGLHVGVVFLLVNALLFGLSFVPRGHIAANVVAVAAIWFYAALTGLSPSATRAAFMFSGAQVAFATSRTRSAANIMCGTAVVMLAVWPGLLFDISFQLSFLAVAALIAWFSPIYNALRSDWRVLNALWATLVVGFVASVATLPLVSHTFGVFSPAGVVLNPVVMVTAYAVVVFSLVWISLPAQFWEPLFQWLVGGPAWLQNWVVRSVAEVPGAAVEWRMPAWGVFASYGVMIIFTVWFGARSNRNDTPEPLRLPRG